MQPTSSKRSLYLACAAICALALAVVASTFGPSSVAQDNASGARGDDHAALVDQGRAVFRDDTFGDETFWGDTLKLHRAIEGAALGGVGAGVSPATALSVGLKVDVDRLPTSVIEAIKAGQVDLNDPATTVALLRANAVVGVVGRFGLKSIGITCGLCHSNVDNSVAPGIGHRLDGWPNRDLNVGAIIDLAPDLAVVRNL